ncbi:hypothetical protein GCM10025762_10850 [Haloechinothrix salitolerans]
MVGENKDEHSHDEWIRQGLNYGPPPPAEAPGEHDWPGPEDSAPTSARWIVPLIALIVLLALIIVLVVWAF